DLGRVAGGAVGHQSCGRGSRAAPRHQAPDAQRLLCRHGRMEGHGVCANARGGPAIAAGARGRCDVIRVRPMNEPAPVGHVALAALLYVGARVRAAWDAGLAWSLRHSPVAMVAAMVLVVCILGAVFAPWLAPHDPFDLRTLNLANADLPPAWEKGGNPDFLFG